MRSYYSHRTAIPKRLVGTAHDCRDFGFVLLSPAGGSPFRRCRVQRRFDIRRPIQPSRAAWKVRTQIRWFPRIETNWRTGSKCSTAVSLKRESARLFFRQKGYDFRSKSSLGLAQRVMPLEFPPEFEKNPVETIWCLQIDQMS